jgi:HK97 family phage major capsid protein
MDYKEKLTQAGKLFADARAILEKADATAEEKAAAVKMVNDAKALKAEAAQLKELEQAALDLAVETKDAKNAPVPTSGFRSLGQFLYAVARAGNVLTLREAVHPLLTPLAAKAAEMAGESPNHIGAQHTGKNGWAGEQKDLAENVGATGGFLVPVEQLTTLLGVEPPPSSVRAKATIIPMRRRQVQVPAVDQTGTTAGQGHWFGGITAKWTEEAQQKDKTEPAFRQIQLTAHELVCYCVSSDVLLDDEAVGLAAFLGGPMGFKGAIDWHEEYAFFQGTGAGQPLGVINAGATISVAAATMVGFTLADSLNMLEDLLPGADATWHFNQRHLSNLYGMTDALGSLIFVPNANEKAPGTLWGYPVNFTEKLPVPGNAGSALLCAWKYYYIGDRKGTTIDSTNLELFRYNQTSWRAVHRVDGQPSLSAPITLQDGSTQVSPFVMLGAKST